MKKLSLLLCAVAALASCETFGVGSGPKYTFNVIAPYTDDLLEISVPSLETITRLTTGLRVVGVDVQIRNTSSKSVTVKWGDSSIDYNGKSHIVFLMGHFNSDAGKAMPDSHLGAGAKSTFGLIPADSVPSAAAAMQAQSEIDPIYSKNITCGISVDLGGETRFYKVSVVIE
jgi:hypothetical protein